LSDLFKRQTWKLRGLWYAKCSRDYSRGWRIELKRRARSRLKRMLQKLVREEP
jgi:hypothetical protein